ELGGVRASAAVAAATSMRPARAAAAARAVRCVRIERAQPQIFHGDLRTVAEQERVMHRVLQLTNVARPRMLEQTHSGFRSELGRAEIQTLPIKLQEMSRQRQNVARALAQRCKLERGRAERGQQLLTEAARKHRLAE